MPHVAELVMLAAGPVALGLFLWRRWNRLDQGPSPPPISPIRGGLLFLGMFISGAIGSLVASYFLPEMPEGEDAEPLWMTAARIGSVFWAQVLFLFAAWPLYRSDRAAPGDSTPRPAGIVSALLIGVGALVLFWPMVSFTVQMAGLAIEWLGGPPAERVGHDTLARLLDSPRDLWFWAITGLVVVPGPILEEILYRGVLQRTMRGIVHHRWLAIGVTSLVFAAMHFDVAQPQAVAGIFVLSLGFGWVYERTGRLVAPAIMHMLFNAANVALTVM